MKDEIDELEAGRELDLRVAEEVLGMYYSGGDEPVSYSKEMEYAFPVLKKFNDLGYVVVLGSKRYAEPAELRWYVLIGTAKPIDEFDMNANILVEVEAKTAELAICRAAVKAIARIKK